MKLNMRWLGFNRSAHATCRQNKLAECPLNAKVTCYVVTVCQVVLFSLFDFTLCTCILLLLRALSKVLLNRSRYWPLCYTRIQSLDLPQANGPPEVLLSGSANHMNHVSA